MAIEIVDLPIKNWNMAIEIVDLPIKNWNMAIEIVDLPFYEMVIFPSVM